MELFEAEKTKERGALAMPLFQAGVTCESIADASRAAVLIDVAHYFRAAKAALLNARSSVFLLGWDFDPRTPLEPKLEPKLRLGSFLNRLKSERQELDIRILIWRMSLPIAAQHWFFPQRSRFWLHDGIDFRLDGTVPYGASRHEKLLVIDDRIAFCGGSDFARDRLDIRSHPDWTHWRVLPNGERYPPRHDVMICVEGEVARKLGDLARARWYIATGERIPAPAPHSSPSPWPHDLSADFTDIPVAIVRTLPARDDSPAVRQNEALYLKAIGAAKRVIYLENQYFAVASVREALAARLMEREGPEIILICTYASPSYFDRFTMDAARDRFIGRLKACDAYGRLRVYAPRAIKGRPIIVHSKLAIFDDRLLRIGSCNLNNRSFGYDTETDLALEANTEEAAQQIARIRNTLLGHYIGWPGERFATHLKDHDSLIAALDSLDDRAMRLRPYEPRRRGWLARLISAWHLGDPPDVATAWRPWLRPKDKAISTISGA